MLLSESKPVGIADGSDSLGSSCVPLSWHMEVSGLLLPHAGSQQSFAVHVGPVTSPTLRQRATQVALSPGNPHGSVTLCCGSTVGVTGVPRRMGVSTVQALQSPEFWPPVPPRTPEFL